MQKLPRNIIFTPAEKKNIKEYSVHTSRYELNVIMIQEPIDCANRTQCANFRIYADRRLFYPQWHNKIARVQCSNGIQLLNNNKSNQIGYLVTLRNNLQERG